MQSETRKIGQVIFPFQTLQGSEFTTDGDDPDTIKSNIIDRMVALTEIYIRENTTFFEVPRGTKQHDA